MGKLNFTTTDINEILARANVSLNTEKATKEELAAILYGIAGGLQANERAMTKSGLQKYFEKLFGNQDVLSDVSPLSIKSSDHIEPAMLESYDSLDIQPGWQIIVPGTITDMNMRFKVRCHGVNPFAGESSLSHYSLEQYVVAGSTPSFSTSNGGAKILNCNIDYYAVAPSTNVQLFAPSGSSNESNWDLVIRGNDGDRFITLYWIPVAP